MDDFIRGFKLIIDLEFFGFLCGWIVFILIFAVPISIIVLSLLKEKDIKE
jgi:hypothetical protein